MEGEKEKPRRLRYCEDRSRDQGCFQEKPGLPCYLGRRVTLSQVTGDKGPGAPALPSAFYLELDVPSVKVGASEYRRYFCIDVGEPKSLAQHLGPDCSYARGPFLPTNCKLQTRMQLLNSNQFTNVSQQRGGGPGWRGSG